MKGYFTARDNFPQSIHHFDLLLILHSTEVFTYHDCEDFHFPGRGIGKGRLYWVLN